ncbi:MAG: hypothetical protein AAB587_02540 [Patescibacteria group bacterium]
MKTLAISIQQSEKKIFLTFVLIVVLSLSLYVYFVNRAVLNIVERERKVGESRALFTRVSELESTLASLNRRVNLKTAYSLGFKDVSATQFIERDHIGQSLSLSNFE